MRNFYLFLTNRNMATRLNVVNPPLREARNDLIYPPRADFRWDFTSSIIPQQSMGVISFTRATTATVPDNEWVIRNCLSGEARFQWARRVQNMTAYSKTFTNPTWTKANLLTVTGNAIAWPAGLGMATSLIETATTTQHGIITSTSYANVAGNVYISSFYAKAGARSFVQLLTNWAISLEYANFDLVNGIFSQSSAGVGAMVSVGDGWYRCSIKYTSLSSTTAVVYCMIGVSLADVRYQSYVGDGVSNVYIDAYQHEDVTGQSVQTAAEYVSTNVLTATPFHGANVDGVKYFDTDVNWVAIPKTTLKWLLAEWARTNLFSDSEDFSLWTKSGTWVITPNATIAPDGRMTADLLTLSTSNEWQSVNKTITTTASIYGYSVYVKPNGHNYIQLLASAGISSGYMNFDLLNGVVGTSSSYTGRIEALPNGWYRLKITTGTVLAATGAFIIAAVPNASASRWSFAIGTGSSGVYLWWAQLEDWRNASSYIPTTTTTATRNIDSLIMDTTNSVNKYGACSFIYTLEDNEQFDRRAFSFTGNTTNRLQFQVKRAWSGANLFYWDGAGVPSITPGRDVWANNVVIAWTNLSNVSLYMDNTKSNSGVAPNLIFTTVDIGSAGGQSWFWCIKNVRIWKTRPTDAELLALSNSSY